MGTWFFERFFVCSWFIIGFLFSRQVEFCVGVWCMYCINLFVEVIFERLSGMFCLVFFFCVIVILR